MDCRPRFRHEVAGFAAAARRVVDEVAPPVPSCPGWSVTDLITHLGRVHRMLAPVIRDRLTAPPSAAPAEPPGASARRVPASLVDWFEEGARTLASLFDQRRPDEPVWTWSADHTVGFWLRMQTIEAAVHRWDMETAVGGPVAELAAELARDMVSQTFEVMVPARRGWRSAPAGSGETFRFRATDGPGDWTVRFAGADVRLVDGPGDVTLSGTASNLALFLWRRVPAADRGEIDGDPATLDRYFTLAPPI
jgi:uncharacterized protein (TIGR03083 family)